MHTSTTIVRDLVVPLEQFPHLKSEESVHTAVARLLAHTTDGNGKLLFDELLVIDSADQYAGRLTIRSILTCYFPSLFDGGDKKIFAGKQEKFTDLAILMEDNFQTECRRQGDLPVSRFMSPPLKSIKADLHPLHAAEIMMEDNQTCLPVVDNQVLVGVIRLIDLFRFLAGSCSL